jgi:hypothetical protein
VVFFVFNFIASLLCKEIFEKTEGAIKNVQSKTQHRKLKDDQHGPHQNTGVKVVIICPDAYVNKKIITYREFLV